MRQLKKSPPWILIAFAILWAGSAAFGYLRANPTNDWPSIDGAVVTLDIKKDWLGWGLRRGGFPRWWALAELRRPRDPYIRGRWTALRRELPPH